MQRTVAARPAKAKSGQRLIGNQNCPKGNQTIPEGNQFSAVMQKVKSSLGPHKAAQELHFLTGEPLSNCQKVLAGVRMENREMLIALAQSHLVVDLVLGLTEGSAHPTAQKIFRLVKRMKLEAELAKLQEDE